MEAFIESIGPQAQLMVPFLSGIVKGLRLKKSARVLDVGTGSGMMAGVLALQGLAVTTGEPEGDNWADWQKNIEAAGVQDAVKFVPFRAEALPFEDGSFDVIFAYGSLHHVDDPRLALQEFFRCMEKKRGVIVIIEPNANGLEHIRIEKPEHPDGIDPRTIIGDLVLDCKLQAGNLFDTYVFKLKK